MTGQLYFLSFCNLMCRVLITISAYFLTGYTTVHANDIAIILGGPQIADENLAALANKYQNNGYQVLVSHSPDTETAAEIMRISERSRQLGKGQRIVILLGDVVHTRNETFFLPHPDHAKELARLYQKALPLSAFFDFTAPAPAQAVIVIGTDGQDLALGPTIQKGLAEQDLPQGVTLITGKTPAILEFAMTRLTGGDESLVHRLEAYPQLEIHGFSAAGIPFSRHLQAASLVDETAAEMAAWNTARQNNSVKEYQAYLMAYPEGRWAQNAKSLLNALMDGERIAAAIEEGKLQLQDEDRRRIQQILVNSGYATNGVDGIFGDVTRQAIERWQKDKGYLATSYLDAPQYIALLSSRIGQSPDFEEKQTPASSAPSFSDNSLAYMKRYKNGVFAEAALALENDDFLKVEQRLVSLELLDKVPDGHFTEATRSAIRNFQLRNKLHASGYLNQQTIKLLSDSDNKN